METKKEQIETLSFVLNEYKKTKNPNGYIMLNYGLYIDGSHIYPNNEKGQDHYKRNCQYIKDNFDNFKALRRLAISEFKKMLMVEFPLSETTITKEILKVFNKSELEDFNKELVEDLKLLVDGI
jgi:hypothetical protein